jgi:2-iminobutanoate/2-iminopropanoate deaminase
MKLAGDGVEEQAEQVMRNMEAILAAAGCTFNDIVKTTVLCASLSARNRRRLTLRRRRLTDIKDFAAVNQIYGRRFPSSPPARSTFAVSALPLGAKVEIEAIAALR